MTAYSGKRGFASDNNAGVDRAILAALSEVNDGHAIAYGDDPQTHELKKQLKAVFGPECEFFLVFTGTAANVLGLAAATQPYHGVICAETAHINVDECGAPEKFTSCKLLSVKTPDGKLKPSLVKQHLHGFGFEHHVQPRLVSLTQATEMGTLYSPDEIRALADQAHEHDLLLHMDGARIANAAAALNCSIAETSTKCGVDILSFGGTKNGMMYGEAIVFSRPELAEGFKYRRKQGMQLASKMRYISAQFLAYLENERWLKNALHANRMARMLGDAVSDIPGVELTQEVQSNAVFARIPAEAIPVLQEAFFFYVWNEERHEVRWMCSFDTREEDVEAFSTLLRKILA